MQENLELRPKSFEEFIGQEKIIKSLKVLIHSANKRKKTIDHILFNGPPGLGKTTLANLVAQENKGNIKFAQGSLIEKKSDILAIFASLKSKDILFIDEIHSINKNVEELIYSAMEEGVVDIPFGVEGEKKIIRMKLPDFSIIGATTKFHNISKPLKDRFGYIANLINYNNDEILKILQRSSKILNIEISNEFLSEIANKNLLIPRKANNTLKRVRDFALFYKTNIVTKEILKETFESLGLYQYGLSNQHIIYLNLLASEYEEKWVSIDTIANNLSILKTNLQENIEPLLIKNSLIDRGSRGRKITTKGIKYILNYIRNKN
ncbi:Holliday junction branch migration DNA helicase RuvB [Mycoplasma iguanae]|uniref:Holliday junction branch migration complex subunit RuvB n=1 Tax=Mycoplasma iguanae TaxID=292461 RepID=A0ABY5R7Q2_9MOLU|nr:Holliday junction branch migration DNA helicase RuvB [Mycoplasma iguanae]UVD81478.1 Holliday junction branch migration DNA helicase RuvB [Mycoplasma iguanae]